MFIQRFGQVEAGVQQDRGVFGDQFEMVFLNWIRIGIVEHPLLGAMRVEGLCWRGGFAG